MYVIVFSLESFGKYRLKRKMHLENQSSSIEKWPWLVHMDAITEYDDYGNTNLGCMVSI